VITGQPVEGVHLHHARREPQAFLDNEEGLYVFPNINTIVRESGFASLMEDCSWSIG